MRCGRCGALAAEGAAKCARCGAELRRVADGALNGERLQAALDALRRGRGADGLACPRCGAPELQAVRPDVETIMFSAVALLLFGVVGLVLIVIGGDVGLFVADLSTLSLGAILLGLLLIAVASYRRRPSAYECRECGTRLP